MVFMPRCRMGWGQSVRSMVLPFSGNVDFGVVLGLVTTLVIAFLLNRFGDTMFRKGVAMPFFLGRRRLHHRHFLFYAVPAIYGVLAAMFLAGYITIVWSLFWGGLVSMVVIAVTCLVFDLTIDYVSGGGRLGFLHHELIYLLVPAYAFTAFLRLAI